MKQKFYIGTYTEPIRLGDGSEIKGEGMGIYQGMIDAETGKLEINGYITGTKNPSYVCADSSGKYLFAVSEHQVFDDGSGGISVYHQSGNGEYLMRDFKSSLGEYPCHIFYDEAEQEIYISNYGSGSVCAYHLKNGYLSDTPMLLGHEGNSVDTLRQKGPHVHSVYGLKDKKQKIMCDLGVDCISFIKAEPKGIKEGKRYCCTKGGGPRILAEHPVLPVFYLVLEMGNTIQVWQYADREKLCLLQEVRTIGEGKIKNTASDVKVSKDGQWVFVSNRGRNTIAMFSVGGDGKIYRKGEFSTGGCTPRSFDVTENGKFLIAANQDSNTVVSMQVKTEGLDLKDYTTVGNPTCVCLIP